MSWTVAMGFGQIVTLRLPASKLAEVNVELERSAWGVFRTECYPAYDFVPVRERIKERVRGAIKEASDGRGLPISTRTSRATASRTTGRTFWATRSSEPSPPACTTCRAWSIG